MSTAAHTRSDREPRPWGAVAAAVWAALLFGVCLLAPRLAIVSVLAPSPLIIQRLRGPAPAALATVGAAALILSRFGLGAALFFLVVLALPTLLIGEAMARGHGLRRGCVWAFLVLSAEAAAGLLLLGHEAGALLTRGVAAQYSAESLAELKRYFAPDQVAVLVDQMRWLEQALRVVYPAVFVVMGGLVVAANAVAVGAYLARYDPGWLDGGELEGLRLPFAVALPFVLCGPAILVSALRPIGYNVLLVLAFLFAAQGFAIVLYFARRLAGPILLRIAIVALVLLNPWPAQLLALLGLFDLWFDFRRFADPPATT